MQSPRSPGDDGDASYWGTLINPDKSPAPLLEELCTGLAKLMVELDAGNGSSDLTPDKLARFYREVGGNYNTLFLETKGSVLSFIYQSLGCFHTLQPTTNPFEAPSIPALLPTGFIRWQVINLLLCPDEYATYLQEAVKRWDVPKPCGGVFPKTIPREAFPEQPDKDMVEWHEAVSQRLLQDQTDHHHSFRRSPCAEYVRYHAAPSGAAREHRHPLYGRAHFSHEESPAPTSRGLNEHPDETGRRHRQRCHSPDDREYRAHMFGTQSGRRRSHSRSSSRNLSPRETPSPAPVGRVPARSKTTSARTTREPTSKRGFSFQRHHRPMTSSDSSNNDEGLLPGVPRRRHGSTDDRRHGRSDHLSPNRSWNPPRRHSHDATSTSPTTKRSEAADDHHHHHHHQSSSSSSRHHHAAVPPAKFYEDMFVGTTRPSRTAQQYHPLPYEIHPRTSSVPRVHVDFEGVPTKARPSSSKRGSGSSGSNRTRSSSYGSGGETGRNRNGSPYRGKNPVHPL